MKKNKLIQLLVLSVVACCPVAKSFSQVSIPVETIKSILVQDWERAKSYTSDYMKAMPADKYSFRANDSVRTFAQQLLHLAQANTFFMSIAKGEAPSRAGRDLEKAASAQKADSVMYFVNNSYDMVINTIKNMTPAQLLEDHTVNMGQAVTVTSLGWMMKAFEHQTHHRGQTTIYLRIAGAHPPQERLF